MAGTNSPSREFVMSSLFTILSGAQLRAGGNAFVTSIRKWIHYNQVAQAEMPMLMMLEDDEVAERARAGMPPRRLEMMVQVQIYAWAGGIEVPSSILNPLLDAVDDIMQPGPGLGINVKSVGGAYDAWISGKIVKVPGYADGKAVALIPIRVLLP